MWGVAECDEDLKETCLTKLETVALEKIKDPDLPLVLRAGQGDRHACALLVDRHLNRVTQLAFRLTGNQADAEEVAQDVFLRVWRHAGRWKPGRARFSTWLYRVTFNLCMDRRRRVREHSLIDADAPQDESAGQEDILHDHDVAASVEQALRSLPDRQRTAIALCHFQGLSNGEAAAVLNVSVEAIESLLSRGRRRLHDRLRHRIGDLLGGA